MWLTSFATIAHDSTDHPEDTTALIALANATGLFPPSELELLRQMLIDSFGENSDTEPF
jgi:hypothetical protein